jgi:soluble lytic murein transglycosylase-like protein
MTLPHLLRTSTIAAIGAVALIITTQARAEGGEGPSIVLPQAADAEASKSPEAEPQAVAAEEADTPAPSKKDAKAGRKVTAKASARAAAETAQATSATAGVKTDQAQDVSVEQTSALGQNQPGAGARSRQSDAVRAQALKPLIAEHAAENALPVELAHAVVRIESRYNAKARNGVNLGLTQINFQTAQSLGYKGDAAGLLDAETNLRYGLKYLAMAYKLAGGDTCGTILRYQFGLRTQTMTGASRAYCSKVKTIIATAE